MVTVHNTQVEQYFNLVTLLIESRHRRSTTAALFVTVGFEVTTIVLRCEKLWTSHKCVRAENNGMHLNELNIIRNSPPMLLARHKQCPNIIQGSVLSTRKLYEL